MPRKLGLINKFGADRQLDDITSLDADGYKSHMLGTDKLAPMTVRKRLQFAKTIFRAAVRGKLIDSKPFDDVSVVASMSDRKRFVSEEEIELILNECPDMNWKWIIGLARFGGLRCPREVLSLKWADVDWENDRLRVHGPKTEHHPGKASRVIPLFPLLRALLDEAFGCRKSGYVLAERCRQKAMGPSGWRNVNLRKPFESIIKRAGLTPWPRLFHNLRSSFETDLAERFPVHVVAEWLGHSVDVATKHYTQTTDEHFRKIAAKCAAVWCCIGQHGAAREKCRRKKSRCFTG